MGDSKQVKVDNWGIFFLQRLQTFFNKTYFCDLTLQFEDNVQLKVHRLVMNACTEYFQVLEQTCEVINDCLIMPPDLQADVVVPIVNFMYTGILEFQTSIFDRLYSTARLMNMTVLTKLLDAQKVPISPIPKPLNKRTPVTPITWNLQGKKIAPKTMDPDLPETLPGRKLPIWKRKSVPSTISYRSDIITGIPDPLSSKYFRSNVEEPPKPTRFEWPDDDDTNFDTNSFDEISYTSKPIVIPHREKSPKPSTSSNHFEELKRTSVAVKRAASPVYNESKKVNIQDVKEYIKEQKLRSDYIDYDDAEAADNDLQTYENDNDSDDDQKEDIFDQNAEDTPNKSILKNDTSAPHNKRVRFSLEGKENAASKTSPKPTSAAATIKTNSSSVDMTNHTKIITEVLKKYPHLVKKNKNIKLKILAKGANIGSAGLKPIGTPVKVVKPTTKVSYMVKKPCETNNKSGSTDIKKDGHWSCHRCSNPNPLIFETYYLYRKHLTEIHNEKADSQMCNICGHVSRKQNMLIYHKLIKHNVTPPPSYQFPKCKDCSYIALSQAMLVKHQLNHTHQNNTCSECNTPFPTKSALISHVQLTGHTGKNNCPTFDCTYCTKKFISDETLFQHIKNNHKEEARQDYIISPVEEEDTELKENVITAEEIDALEDHGESSQQEVIATKSESVVEKSKEKIKILSDVKVSSAKQPIKVISTEGTSAADSQTLEPSSEAESLSNVASGIAASLGLVNTIVVLDENQFIIQSPDGNQENIIGNPQNIILPDVTNINNIQNLVSQHHQVITTDANSIISQATLAKSNITSTDELVMVLTDHDYSDASNNTVITSENSNIVVLYSHPVQSQDGQFISQSSNLMINSDMGLVEVGNNYAVANTVSMDDKQCEESIELIQQEINNHLEGETHEIPQQTEKIVEEQVIDYEEVKSDTVIQESELQLQEIPKEVLPDESEKMEVEPIEEVTEDQTPDVELTAPSKSPEMQEPSQNEVIAIPADPEVPKSVSEEHGSPKTTGDNHFEEPMEIEESIEMIQQEIHRSSTEVQEIPTEHQETTSEDIPPTNLEEIVEENNVNEVENVEPVQGILETKTDEPSVINESEAEECEQRKEINDENQEAEVEHMEVDSANLVTNENIETETTLNNIKDEQSESKLNSVQDDQSEIIHSSIQEEKSDCVEDIVSQENITEQELSTQEETTEQVTEVLPQKELTEHQLEEPDVIPEENQKHIKQDNTLEIANTLLPENIEKEISDLMEDNPVESKIEVTKEPEEILVSPVEAEDVEESKDSNENSPPDESQDSDVSQEKEKINLPEDSNEVQVVTSEESTTKDVKIILDDWDDGDTDSQQSDTPKPTPVTEESRTVVNTLINDWEDEEET